MCINMNKRYEACSYFDNEVLNSLKDDKNACVAVVTSVHHLSLHPFHLSDLKGSVKELLDKGIPKYNRSLNGILIGYESVKILDSLAPINLDSCFIHIDIEADFFVFRPEVGQTMNGTVNKKSSNHIGCLVHNTFNISVPKSDNDANWLGHQAQIGQEIEFMITFAELDAKLPYIKAKFLSILSQDNGFNNVENVQNKIIKFDSDAEEAEDVEVQPKKNKKRKHELIEAEDEIAHKTKKHKKTKIEDVDIVEEGITGFIQNEEHDQLFESKAAKTKKHKKTKIEEVDIVEEGVTGYIQNEEHDQLFETNAEDVVATKTKKHKKNKIKDVVIVKEEIIEDVSYEQLDNFIEAEAEEEIVSKSKKHKKNKTKDVVIVKQEFIEDVQNGELDNLVEADDLTKSKKKKKKLKKEKRDKNQDSDISLPELNLEALFDEDRTSPSKTFNMADVHDKGKLKRRRSTAHKIELDNIELPHDSDLEDIIAMGKKELYLSSHKNKKSKHK